MRNLSDRKAKIESARTRTWVAFVAVTGLCVLTGLAQDAWKAPLLAARKKNPISADANSLAQGKKLYDMACAACHGKSGKGDGPAAASLTPKPRDLSDPEMWEQTDGALFWKISEGKTPMPAFGSAITDGQRWSVVNYIRTLAPVPAGARAGTNSIPATNTVVAAANK